MRPYTLSPVDSEYINAGHIRSAGLIGRRPRRSILDLANSTDKEWLPVASSERYVALLGVLLVNLESDFRVSLARHILVFHTARNRLDCAVDAAGAGLLEFKAITIFSLLFGAGSAIFDERAATRSMNGSWFLARRYLFLLLIGLCHLLLIWNGDILTLHAVCGILLLPILRMKTLVSSTACGPSLLYILQ